MQNQTALPFDLSRIQEVMNIPPSAVDNCPIPTEKLKIIYDDYTDFVPVLEKRRIEILSDLNEGLPGEVHSIRSRVKTPDHLIAKIIRSVYSNPVKYQWVTRDNYRKIITDLIGIRIILLDRRDWRQVQNALFRIYRNIPERYIRRASDIRSYYDKFTPEIDLGTNTYERSYLAERPVAYITSRDDRVLYRDEFLKLDTSKAHYRSLHYIIRFREVYFELQMRSLFEEGWLEFDHRMKYPNDLNNKKKQDYIQILSNLAVAADQLISCYDEKDFREARDTDPSQKTYSMYPRLNSDTLTLEEKMKLLF